MKKTLAVVYETDLVSPGSTALYVVDPDITLPNGNNKVIKILIDSYADDIYKELTEVYE